MALVETCKCEECGLQRSFANHWVMIIERKESLTVLPIWDEKKIRRTRHFCGRAHASRYVERWIASPGMALVPDVLAEAEFNRSVRTAPADDQRTVEQMLMEDERGEEMSSARVVPSKTIPIPSAAQVPAMPIPPAVLVPPMPPSYMREMRIMS